MCPSHCTASAETESAEESSSAAGTRTLSGPGQLLQKRVDSLEQANSELGIKLAGHEEKATEYKKENGNLIKDLAALNTLLEAGKAEVLQLKEQVTKLQADLKAVPFDT